MTVGCDDGPNVASKGLSVRKPDRKQGRDYVTCAFPPSLDQRILDP